MCNHTDSIDLQKYKNVYFIGIGGSSMSSLAMILKRRGCVVRGYDRAHTRETEMLQNSGIPVYDTTDASHFDGAELIVYTVAFAPDHPEMVLAAQRGVPVIPRARLLEAIAADYPNSIGIAGTHGKSTTSGMTAQIFLSEEHADPTVLIGAALPAIGAAYRIGNDGNFIFEACEYKDSFLSFYPRIAVVLNVRLDHTDYFASLEQLKRSFRQFMNNAGDSGIALVNADAPDAVEAARDVLPQVRYFSVKDPAADYFAGSITYDGGFASFDIYAFGTLLCRASLSVIGSFNVSNALAAAASAHLSGVSAKAIARVVPAAHLFPAARPVRRLRGLLRRQLAAAVYGRVFRARGQHERRPRRTAGRRGRRRISADAGGIGALSGSERPAGRHGAAHRRRKRQYGLGHHKKRQKRKNVGLSPDESIRCNPLKRTQENYRNVRVER